MNRRSLAATIGGAITAILAGCSEPATDDASPDDSDDSEGIDSEFDVLESGCVDGDVEDDLDSHNDVTIEFQEDGIRIDGTIVDGEPNRTAELRDYDMDWADSPLYVSVFHVDGDEPTEDDCPSATAYGIDFTYRDPQDRATSVRVEHNGRTVGDADADE